MAYVPHTKADIQAMLQSLNLQTLDQLFDEIPSELNVEKLHEIPDTIDEYELLRHMQQRANLDECQLNFAGAGAYEHHIPAAVWNIVTRGEYMTAYTPYQAEASQGTLQLLYEYQTMMAKLMAMDISNASLYDGATAVAEAILMAARAKRGKLNQVLLAGTLHPHYRQTINTIVRSQGIELVDVPYCPEKGITLTEAMAKVANENTLAVVIQQPNFFGCLEQVDDLVTWAHSKNYMTIGVVNPTAMSLIKPPGEWGDNGIDIACGEGQPLGVPLASGGPYFGFMCCKKEFVRQLPGRLIGRTTDNQGRVGYTLTLQAREQHIRRSKATSNICTNQGLLVTAATIYMSVMGATGLKQVALKCHQQTSYLKQKLAAISGIEVVFTSPTFHEVVVRVANAEQFHQKLINKKMLAGVLLAEYYPELEDCLLLCATETKFNSDIDQFVDSVKECLG